VFYYALGGILYASTWYPPDPPTLVLQLCLPVLFEFVLFEFVLFEFVLFEFVLFDFVPFGFYVHVVAQGRELIVGLSYYSQSRHEMRVAFWWKLNWSWFCLIQLSYNKTMIPPTPSETRPFPNIQQLDTEYSHPASSPSMKTEDPHTTTTITNNNNNNNNNNSDTKKEDPNNSSSSSTGTSPTLKSSDQDTISEPMDEVITSYTVPPRLQRYWDLALRGTRKRRWPREMGSQQWLEVGDFLVELGHELARFGLLDMELGLWENEIMHRMDPVSFIPPYLLHRYYFFFVCVRFLVLWWGGRAWAYGRDWGVFGCVERA